MHRVQGKRIQNFKFKNTWFSTTFHSLHSSIFTKQFFSTVPYFWNTLYIDVYCMVNEWIHKTVQPGTKYERVQGIKGTDNCALAEHETEGGFHCGCSLFLTGLNTSYIIVSKWVLHVYCGPRVNPGWPQARRPCLAINVIGNEHQGFGTTAHARPLSHTKQLSLLAFVHTATSLLNSNILLSSSKLSVFFVCHVPRTP